MRHWGFLRVRQAASFGFAALLVLCASASVRAGDTKDNGAKAASYRVVEAQLNAVRARDAARAYALVAPATQQKFPDAKAFLRALRFHDQGLYKHVQAKHLASVAGTGSVLHRVEVTDRDGAISIVLFRVVPGPEVGSWRIQSATSFAPSDDDRSI